MIGRRRGSLGLASGLCVLALGSSAAAEDARTPPAASDAKAPAQRHKALQEVPGVGVLMPLRFTTFGDFYYAVSNVERDDFHIGTLELDVSLALNDFVDVTAGLTFDGAVGSFGLGSFTIDCGIAGNGSHYLVSESFLERSGVVFGKFDVPLGIAYLEYASPDNRLVTLPNAARSTHGGWNDIGVQFYAQERRANVIAYVVNGSGLDAASFVSGGAPDDPTSLEAADDVWGGRFGLSLVDSLEVGISGAAKERGGDFVGGLYGADLRATPGDFDFRLEAIERPADMAVTGPTIRGAYGRALYRLDRLFATARYGVVLADSRVLEREIVAGVGAAVFPKAEIRVVHAHELETGAATFFFQLVGGSAWQPTGFRR